MYDINLKNIKNGNVFFLIFLVAGLFFLFIMVGTIPIFSLKTNDLDGKTTSIRVEIKNHNSNGTTLYTPIYFYIVDESEYSCSSPTSSINYPSNQNKIIYYDPNNPEICATEKQNSNLQDLVPLLFLILPISFIVLAVVNMIKISKRIKLVKELNKNGKLVKNLPYRLENTGMSVNNVKIKRPVVDYTLPSGSVIKLSGDPRHDRKLSDADGMVDLVIDENNPNNYFIDFEINRLSGNLPQDFYTPPNCSEQIENYNESPSPYQPEEKFVQHDYSQHNSDYYYDQSLTNYDDIHRPL